MNAHVKPFKSLNEFKVRIDEREFCSDGNAFALLGKFRRQAKRQNFTMEEIDAVLKEAMSSNYDKLLQTLLTYTDLTGEYDEPECERCGFPSDDPVCATCEEEDSE